MISSRRVSLFHAALRLDSALPFVLCPVSSLSCVRARTLSRLLERRDAWMQFQRKRSGETRELAPFLSSVARSIARFEKAGTATFAASLSLPRIVLFGLLDVRSSSCRFADSSDRRARFVSSTPFRRPGEPRMLGESLESGAKRATVLVRRRGEETTTTTTTTKRDEAMGNGARVLRGS